jgi:putative transposase
MLSFPPSRSIGQVVGNIKSITAKILLREFPELKHRFWAGVLWEDGYFVRSVGRRMTSEVIKKCSSNNWFLTKFLAEFPVACHEG